MANKRNHSLDPQQREFFALVSRVVFSNPFDDSGREEVQGLVVEAGAADSRHQHHFNALVGPLGDAVAVLDEAGISTLQAVASDDRKLIEHAYLFLVFARFIDELDSHIDAQSRQDQPLALECAEPLMAQLKMRGFSDNDCLRYLALFFQLRRAYYFIARSLIGPGESMKKLRCHLWNNVFTYDVRLYDDHLWNRMEDFSTLLLGETGTGKGAAAAAIGRSGFIPFDRHKGCFRVSFRDSFVPLNLSQFPESLIESELFGHTRGAFTGAVDNHKGVFERCSEYGALFLDEIGDVSVPVQIKLLKVLQERLFSAVGSHREQRFSGRVVAATHRPLDELRRQGRFRDDFFYRLCSDLVVVPPLRQRIAEHDQELPMLTELLLQRMTGEDSPAVTGLVLEALTRDLPADYPWPGNVRELEQAIRRILLTRRYLGDSAAQTSVDDDLVASLDTGKLTARELLGHYCAQLYRQHGTYEKVAQLTELDRRTVKKYVEEYHSGGQVSKQS